MLEGRPGMQVVQASSPPVSTGKKLMQEVVVLWAISVLFDVLVVMLDLVPVIRVFNKMESHAKTGV